MKSIWKKYLGLTASLLAAAAQPAGSPASDVIASSAAQPVPAIVRPVVTGRGPAVTLEQPRLSNFAVQQVSFQQPVIRAQSTEPGFAEAPTPNPAPTLPAPTVATPHVDVFPMSPQLLGGDAGPALDGYMIGVGIDPDRFGRGDGVSHQFNNCFSVETEGLLWQMRGSRLPPLVTTGIPAPPPFTIGAMIMPTTQLIFGGNTEDTGIHSGERIRATWWVDGDHALGVEGSFFYLSEESSNFSRSSDGSTVLAIPFLGLNGAPSAVVLGGDGRTVGGVSASLKDRMWGAEANFRSNILVSPTMHLDLIGGFRALGLDDSLNLMANRTTAIGGGMMISQTAQDSFAARNRFYGGQLGAEAEWLHGRWSLGLTSKLAIGGTVEKVEITGGSTLNGLPTSGGIFSQSTNSRTFHKDRFSFVPEFTIKVGYQLTDYLRATLGYNFLYWTDVARGGEQIDPVLAGTGRPAFAFRGTDFWTQGLTVGLELRY
jgi:hypothetical protein